MAFFFSQFTDAEIFIEKSFSFQLNGKKKSIRPDITIKRENLVTNFFDVKMDLGWKRSEFADYCVEKSKIIKEMRGQQVDFWKGYPVLLNDELKYEIIIISKENISKEILNKNLDKIREANIDNEVPIYFLTNKVHPNHGDSQFARDNIEINDEQLNELREKIRII